jgi:hypothetical protein
VSRGWRRDAASVCGGLGCSVEGCVSRLGATWQARAGARVLIYDLRWRASLTMMYANLDANILGKDRIFGNIDKESVVSGLN